MRHEHIHADDDGEEGDHEAQYHQTGDLAAAASPADRMKGSCARPLGVFIDMLRPHGRRNGRRCRCIAVGLVTTVLLPSVLGTIENDWDGSAGRDRIAGSHQHAHLARLVGSDLNQRVGFGKARASDHVDVGGKPVIDST